MEKRAVGFALAFVALKETGAYLHSHMVGVLAEYRDRGVGRLLKLAQREDALARGIDLIEWTFDPLQLKNARVQYCAAWEPSCATTYPICMDVRRVRYMPGCRQTGWWRNGGFGRAAWKKLSRIRRPWRPEKWNASQFHQRFVSMCGNPPYVAAEIQSRVRRRFEELIAAGYAADGF